MCFVSAYTDRARTSHASIWKQLRQLFARKVVARDKLHVYAEDTRTSAVNCHDRAAVHAEKSASTVSSCVWQTPANSAATLRHRLEREGPSIIRFPGRNKRGVADIVVDRFTYRRNFFVKQVSKQEK